MTIYCLDTNYLLRLILNDNSEQVASVELILEQASQGKISCWISIVVQMEIVFVLSSFYNFDHKEIAAKIKLLYELTFLDFEHYKPMKQSLEIYSQTSLSIQDSFLISFCNHKKMQLLTFDKKAMNQFNKSQK